ncbi:AmmeMemoRadiSam system radical SAM enzyme [bacterium]|nr:AmmeMemoRadiSam system radical SAM enzyme [bacterium]
MDRRCFVKQSICAGCAMASGIMGGHSNTAFADVRLPVTKEVSNKEAMHYDKLEDQKVKCVLCPKECSVADGERGYCGVRENQKGEYKTLVYGRPCTLHVDPIEKKPLFHYRPGTRAFSIATAGCNMECKFCQNWDISQFRPEQVRMMDLPPKRTAELAKQAKSETIAYTYSEPVIFYEYMHDTAVEARTLGIGSVMISNGYIKEKALKQLLPKLTGIKVDFKGFTESFYKDYCNGEMKPVLHALETIKEMGTWLELVVLIIPTLNDSDQENKDMAKWIVKHLGPDVPVHLSRYHPTYKIKNIPPTPIKTLERIRQFMMDAGNHYVYIGNAPGHEAEHTYCPSCQALLIQRLGFSTTIKGMENGRCEKCKTEIPGIWKDPLAR